MMKYAAVGVLAAALALAFPVAATEAGRVDGTAHVRSIDIETRNVFADDEAAKRPLYRLFNRLHKTTRESVIRRELWFDAGATVTDAELEELERNLRGLGLFGEVEVELDAADNLSIVSRDQFSFVPIIVPFSVGSVDGFQFFLSEWNLFGKGDRLLLRGSSNSEDEESISLGFTDIHFLDTWHRLSGSITSTEEGPGFSLGINRPFKHLQDPWSWGANVARTDTETDFFSDGDSTAEVPVDTSTVNLRLARAGGPRDRRRSAGLAINASDTRYGIASGRDAATIRVPGDTTRISAGPFFRYDVTRIYDKARDLDTLDFTQDIRLGLRTELFVAASHRDEQGADSRFEPIVSGSGSLALKPLPETYLTFAASGSVRQYRGTTQGWSQSAALHAFQQSLPRQTLAASIAYDEVFEREELSVQLTLGEDNGLRGYPARQFSGLQRLRLNIEDRIDTRLQLRSIHLGLVAFFDAGWIGDDSFGKPRTSAGAGLRFASSELFGSGVVRLDVAYPLNEVNDLDQDVSVSLAWGQVFSFFGSSSILPGR